MWFSGPIMGSRVLIGISSPPFVASPAGLPGGYAPGALLGVTGSNPDFGDFRNVSEKGFSRAASGSELGSCSEAARKLLGSASGVPREGLGSDWSDRERLHFFTKWAIARLIVRWKDSLRNARRVTHSVHVWDNGKHAHERTNGFAAHLALLRRRLEVLVGEHGPWGRILQRGSALGLVRGLHGHVVFDGRRVGLHFSVFTATRFSVGVLLLSVLALRPADAHPI